LALLLFPPGEDRRRRGRVEREKRGTKTGLPQSIAGAAQLWRRERKRGEGNHEPGPATSFHRREKKEKGKGKWKGAALRGKWTVWCTMTFNPGGEKEKG